MKYAQEELAKNGCPYTIHTLYDAVKTDEPKDPTFNRNPSGHAAHKELHISLSHPLPLRSHQIPDLLQHLKVQLSSSKHPDIRSFRLGLDCRVVKYRNGIARTAAKGGPAEDSSGHTDVGRHGIEEEYEDETLGEATAQYSGAARNEAGNLLGNLGKSGVGKGGRAFLALRVRAGHGEVRLR